MDSLSLRLALNLAGLAALFTTLVSAALMTLSLSLSLVSKLHFHLSSASGSVVESFSPVGLVGPRLLYVKSTYTKPVSSFIDLQ